MAATGLIAVPFVAATLESGGCVGCSVAIYDPEQDAGGRCAAQIVEFARRIAQAI